VDWSKLPDLIAVGLLAWAFASVARRFRTIASQNWLSGWYCIVLHFAIQLFGALPGIPGKFVSLFSLLTLMMAAMLFMRASAPLRAVPVVRVIMFSMSSLFTINICALVFDAPYWFKNSAATVLCLAPLALTLLYPAWSTRTLRLTVTLLHLGMWPVLWMVRNRPDGVDLSFDAILFVLYMGCAAHFWYHNRKATSGALIGIIGFILWAAVFIVAPLLAQSFPSVVLETEIWNLPKYVVAVGMILLILEDQIAHKEYLALHDELTGLPNRRLFQDRLARAIERARRAENQTALLVVDLDDFKGVNDTYGHDIGDQLLQQVASLFSDRIRHSDTVARTGGDEFAVILEPPANRTEAALVRRALLELLKNPVRLGEHDVQIGASVGIAIFPDDAKDAKALCIRADLQMYEGKKRGGMSATGYRIHGERAASAANG
jgi:diguanylate cyclase